jgi:hypothetical protein
MSDAPQGQVSGSSGEGTAQGTSSSGMPAEAGQNSASERGFTGVANPQGQQTPQAPAANASFPVIPQQFREDPDFQDFKSVDEVFTSYKELKGLQDNRDRSGVTSLISEQSTPEEVHAFYTKLGKPESSAEYGFEAPEDLPEGLDYSDERAAKFANLAHEIHLTKDQASQLFEFYHNEAKEQYAEVQGLREEALDSNLTQLEEAWGGVHGSEKFNDNYTKAMRAFNTVADQELADKFNADPLIASNPLMLQLLSRLGGMMDPDITPSVSSQVPAGSFQDSAAAIDKQIKEFYSTGKFKEMMDSSKPELAKQRRAEWKALYDKQRKLSG